MFAVLNLPQFALQAALRYEPELWSKPVALVDPAERGLAVYETTDPARAAGVIPGLTPTQAMARCSQILIRPRSPKQEEVTMGTLLQCAYQFSPQIEATRPGLCTMDLRGLAVLSGKFCSSSNVDLSHGISQSELSLHPPQKSPDKLRLWAERIQQTLALIQLKARIGLGPTPNVARHGARWGESIEIVTDPEKYIAALPLSALDPSTEIALILHRWGIQTVGELLALGTDALTNRLGLEALALQAAASTKDIRPLRLVHPTERFEESFEFEAPVETVEPLLFLLKRFVSQLSQRLEWRGFVARMLVLNLPLESGQKLTSRLRLPQSTREPEILFRILQTHLETLQAESPIRSISLKILPQEEEQKQLGLFETTLADPLQFQETLARLAAILGADRVGTPTLENSHRSDAFRIVPPDFENAPIPKPNSERLNKAPIPFRRFRPAVPAAVTCEPTQDHKKTPTFIRCAVVQGKLQILLGPWRSSGHWWDANAWEREEWDAATSDGKVLRLVHCRDGWFVEGIMD